MIDLKDFQFELLLDSEGQSGVGFGIGLGISIDSDGFDPGTAEWIVQDTVNPSNGTTLLGRDHLAGPTWAWAAHVNQDAVTTALPALATLAKAWRAGGGREPGRICAVRYQLDGRRRRVYGRPRRFNAPPDNRILNGFVAVTMDFKTIDPLTYDDVASSTLINFVSNSAGGLTFPTTFPVSPLPSGNRQGSIQVGGDMPTYPVIRFTGPIVNPSIEYGGRKLALNYTIADGSYVEIDTRPWRQTVLLNGTANVAGALGRRQYLRDMVMAPGGHDIAFRGQSASGLASCSVTWRSAWASY